MIRVLIRPSFPSRRIIRAHRPISNQRNKLSEGCYDSLSDLHSCSVGQSEFFCQIVRPWGCRIIRCHCAFLVSLLHLSNLSQRSFGHSKYIHCDLISLRWIGHLVSTVHWTCRLDGALDVSTAHWTSRILLGLYPRDLKNPTNKILQTC